MNYNIMPDFSKQQRDFLKGSIKQGVTPDELLNAYKRAIFLGTWGKN